MMNVNDNFKILNVWIITNIQILKKYINKYTNYYSHVTTGSESSHVIINCGEPCWKEKKHKVIEAKHTKLNADSVGFFGNT